MEIKTEDKILSITLPSECTIARTEADTDRIKAIVSGDFEKIEILADAVEEIDTAYFQMLLSVKVTAEQKGIPFLISKIPGEVQRICELYGVELDI